MTLDKKQKHSSERLVVNTNSRMLSTRQNDTPPLVRKAHGSVLQSVGFKAGLVFSLKGYWDLCLVCFPVSLSSGRFGKKHIGFVCHWKRHITRRMSILALSRHVEKCNGLCVKTGKVSGITVVDSDLLMDESMLKHFERLFSFAPLVKTPRGFHLYFSYEQRLQSARYADVQIDIKNDGAIVIAPPSSYAGKTYSWIRPIEGELKPMPDELFLLLMELQAEREARKAASRPCRGQGIKIKALHELSAKQRHYLDVCLAACVSASLGNRSERDFYLCLFAIRAGLEKGVLWSLCGNVGKFKTDGISYFDFTYGNALRAVKNALPK